MKKRPAAPVATKPAKRGRESDDEKDKGAGAADSRRMLRDVVLGVLRE